MDGARKAEDPARIPRPARAPPPPVPYNHHWNSRPHPELHPGGHITPATQPGPNTPTGARTTGLPGAGAPGGAARGEGLGVWHQESDLR